MTTEYSGDGDPRRTLELLWGARERSRRGPKPRITLERLVRAAIAVADTEGLPALSMRRVADALGVSAMSLYTYVPGKAELFDLMLDAVYAETARPPHVPGQWRESLTGIARENFALYRRHPWLLQVATNRPLVGPGLSDKYEYELRAVEGIGLDDIEMDSVIATLDSFVHGAARAAVGAAQVVQRTGLTDAEWWEATGPLLVEMMEGTHYPVSERVGSAVGERFNSAGDPEHYFAFGLERILDGVDALVTRRA